jgi:hypothetical protein
MVVDFFGKSPRPRRQFLTDRREYSRDAPLGKAHTMSEAVKSPRLTKQQFFNPKGRLDSRLFLIFQLIFSVSLPAFIF